MSSLLLWLALASAHPLVGDPMPQIPLVGLAGEKVTWPADATVAVVFFATWCEPCHAALADIRELRRTRGGFQIVLVAVGEAPAKVRSFLAQRPGTDVAAVVLDRTGDVARAFGQDRFPTTFLVDGKGIVRHINRGYGRGYHDRIERWLSAMAQR
jgi:cytochrome c biogenesis protein CcmG/thiol:disulfide interchange protein DsbE